MKILLALMLLIPSLSWGQDKDELKDRESWRQAGHEYKNNSQYEEAMNAYLKGGYDDLANDMKRKITYEEILIKMKDKCNFNSNSIEDRKICLEQTFFISDEPVNPKIIEEFVPLPSDASGIIQSINLDLATNSNKYCCKYEFEAELDDNELIVTEYFTDRSFFRRNNSTTTDPNHFFEYKFLGTSNNGVIILQTDEHIGAFWDDTAVLLLRVEILKNFKDINEDENKIEFIYEDNLGLKLLAYFWGEIEEVNLIENNIRINNKLVSLNFN